MLYNSKPKKKTEIQQKKPRKRTPSIKSLRDKLDVVFSKYIRLRDSRNFGYYQFVCISCGETKPYSQMDFFHSGDSVEIAYNPIFPTLAQIEGLPLIGGKTHKQS